MWLVLLREGDLSYSAGTMHPQRVTAPTGPTGPLLAEIERLHARVRELEGLVACPELVEAALRESEERYRVLVEHSPDAIVMLDMDVGRFVDCNAGAERLYGLSRAELLARGPVDLSPATQPDGRASAEAALDYIGRCLAGELPSFEWVHRRPSGRELLCEVRLARLPRAGRFLVCGSITDISARKEAEREQQSLEAKIQQAQKLESLGVLAGGIAHDFNNLLMSMLGFSDLALEDLSEAHPARSHIGQIRKAALAAADLTHDLLAYSGGSSVETRRIDLNDIVRELATLLGVAVSKKVTLETDLDATLPAIDGDAAQLRQVIMNLITNASEAAQGGRGRVTVRTRLTPLDARRRLSVRFAADELPETPMVTLEVTDDGVGMDAETLARIFDPFFTTKVSGRGLGLAAVGGIVRSHGGAIAVESRPGSGTAFTVYLPVRADTHAGPSTASAPDEPTATSTGGRVLVIDDEALVRDVAQSMLEAMGFEVSAAPGGRQGLAWIEAEPDAWRLVLLDLTMPDMDGAEVLRQIRARWPALPVLLVSGYTSHNVAVATGASALHFLQKPFTLASLREAIAAALAEGL